MVGTQGKHIKGTKIATCIGDLAEKQHPIPHAKLTGLRLEILFQPPGTEDHQLAIGRQTR
ncbi:hypothetical protein D9M71_829120 [compost metagenome]